MICLSIIGLLDIVKGKIVISENQIEKKGVFGNRKLSIKDIKGFKTDRNYLHIIPIRKTKKRIKISVYNEGLVEIIQWLNLKFPDLDVEDKENESKTIFKNMEYGRNEKERTALLNKAKLVSRVLIWLSVPVVVWAIVKPVPYEYVIWFLILLPIISIFVIFIFRGLIIIDENNDRLRPSAYTSIFVPVFGLIMRSFADYHILNYDNVWFSSLIIGLFLIVIVFMSSVEYNKLELKQYLTLGFLFLLLIGFGFGATINFNCLYDKSEPEYFDSIVLDKKIMKNKTNSYYIKLKRWGSLLDDECVYVKRELFDSLNKNDNVKIYQMKVAFDIPWFYIKK